jgi:hypothetical protein
MPNQPIKIDYRDTFLDADHLRASFPNAVRSIALVSIIYLLNGHLSLDIKNK